MGFSWVIIVKGVRKLQADTNRYDYDYSDIDYLLRKVATGDTDALSQIYKLTATTVYAYALSILKNQHDAEDVLHDCFVRIFTYTSSYHSQGKAMGWILTIARNLCMNKLQHRKREPQLSEQNWREYIDNNTFIRCDEKLLLRSFMDILPEDDRQILILHAVSSMSFREIAQFMQLPISTVISKYRRSLQRIKKYIGEEER